MTDDPNWDLLDRFFAGECTPAEQADIARWLETHPVPAKYVAALRRGFEIGDAVPSEWETDGAWARLARTTSITPEPRPAAPLRLVARERPRRLFLSDSSWLRVAAVAVLMAGSAALWWFVAQRPRPMREFATARGQRADMRLADGTHIVLSVDSKLLVPADFGAATRDVYLHGEAYFDVVHDPAKPFAVHVDNATVRDVGTRFGVRAYLGERRVQVVVAEGRVALQATELGAGQLARLDSAGALSVASHVEVSRYLGWTEGRLALYDTPLADALPNLARWYDLDITLAEATLGQRRFTFEARGEPLAQVLDGIALLVHARYERHGRSVTFHLTEDVR